WEGLWHNYCMAGYCDTLQAKVQGNGEHKHNLNNGRPQSTRQKNTDFFRGSNFSTLNHYINNYLKKSYLYFALPAAITFLYVNSLSADEIKSEKRINPVYKCYKVPEGTIHIDGKLNEKCWQNAPVMEFRDLANGSKPFISSCARLVWNDEYIYVAYEIHDPDVVAYYGERKRGGTHTNVKGKQDTGEPEIMFRDTFVKFFLDPDADGRNYIEIHINPINNVGDLLLDLPYLCPKGGGIASRKALNLPMIKNKYDWYWNCEGLKSAVQVYGTLNYSDDKDEGWTVELAVPWEALRPLTKGAYSPNKGNNKWRAHLGHVYKPEFRYDKRRRSRNLYGTWPVLGIRNCHLPERWGYLIFEKDMLPDKGEK
ncbi:MAG: carbohydrate-binding family 9-like protein, partial [Victivallaceae bacterium]|nr:carbohydrate-binding family 9-like protein [Victivallaceae bacterium]